jgi:hypothetical protein
MATPTGDSSNAVQLSNGIVPCHSGDGEVRLACPDIFRAPAGAVRPRVTRSTAASVFVIKNSMKFTGKFRLATLAAAGRIVRVSRYPAFMSL